MFSGQSPASYQPNTVANIFVELDRDLTATKAYFFQNAPLMGE
jgi:hypothetical protein